MMVIRRPLRTKPNDRAARTHRIRANASLCVAGVLLLLLMAAALSSPLLARRPIFDQAHPSLASPSRALPFGTDNFKRDMLPLVVNGVRISMTVVAGVVALSTALGLALGMLAGYRGGVVDRGVVRLGEITQAIPRFLLTLLVAELYGPRLLTLIALLGITSWTLLARVVRAETLSVRSRPFIDAARAAGARTGRIIIAHVLPSVLPQALVIIALTGSRVVLIEAGLAFLGLGDTARPSLGLLVASAQPFLRYAWWLALFPGLALAAVVLSLNLASDGLRRALDPRGREHTGDLGRALSV